MDAQKFHAARRKALLSFPTGPSHAANSKSSGWFRSHPEDLLHRNRRHSGARDAAALTEGSNASFSFPLPLRSTRSLLRNGDPPAHPKFIDNRGAAFTPRKFMDRFNNHAAIAQNMKCVVNRFLVSHLHAQIIRSGHTRCCPHCETRGESLRQILCNTFGLLQNCFSHKPDDNFSFFHRMNLDLARKKATMKKSILRAWKRLKNAKLLQARSMPSFSRRIRLAYVSMA